MLIAAFKPLIFGGLGGLVIGIILRWAILFDQERRAWGNGRAALSRAQRRAIRRSVGQGRPVGDRQLAGAAVRFGEAVTASSRIWGFWTNNPPRAVVIFGRIFFPLLGTTSVTLGLTGPDPAALVSGALLLSCTVLYLPPTLRRIAARRARLGRRVQAAIDANRRLATAAG